MSTAQLAAASFLARYSGRTHHLYQFQLREWFAWCERSGLDPLVWVQRAHVELYIRRLGERGLMDPSVVSKLCSVRGFLKFAHIDGVIPADPAVYARLPRVQRDESRAQGLNRLELIRFLQVAQTTPSTTAHRRICLASTRCARVRGPRRCGSRPTRSRCAGTASCVWSAKATSRDHAGHRPGAPRARGLPWGSHRGPAGVETADRQPDRPARRLPGHYDRARGNLDQHAVHFLTAYVAGV